jgi:putative PIN family toxin of toxin-antitoxin system
VSIGVVYDTMVFLQAAARPQRLHATFRAVHEREVSLLLSPGLLAEIQDVLSRPAIRTKFPALTDEGVNVFVADVLAHGRMFADVPRNFTWPEHPDDDHVLNLAIQAQAKYLVTWEARILKLATDASPAAQELRRLAPGLEIITPKQLADLLKAQK